jgi:hypothetical protein
MRLIARLAAVYPDDGISNPTSWRRNAQLTPRLLAACETKTTDAV